MDGPKRIGLIDRNAKHLTVLLITGTALLRLIYLAFDCPLDLAPDEAHYWDWSRRLDWSYYSKGPGVAWLIRLSCELFGDVSIWLTGNQMLAVRFPAVICGSLLLTSLYLLTVQSGGRPKIALAVVAMALTTPAVSAGASLMTIDSPYTCCWAWALVFARRAVFLRISWAWWLAGLVVGFGMLCKYTMILWLPSFACFLVFSTENRILLLSRGFWILSGIAALGALPVLIWNAQNDWVTFVHVGDLAGLGAGQSGIHWFGPIQFIAIQGGLWLIFWFVVWARAMFANAPWKSSSENVRYLWWMSAPTFSVFLVFALKTSGGEPNWPVTAYVSGFVLGVLWMEKELRTASGWYRRAAFAGLTCAAVAGLLLVGLIHYSTFAHSLLEPFAGPVTAQQPYPLRRLDPTLRLRGWRELASKVDEVCRELAVVGDAPLMATTTWSLPGLLGFYGDDYPLVYSFGPAFGERSSQYDLWRPNPICDVERFAGRTFLIVCRSAPDLGSAFTDIETRHVVTHLENGQPLADWVIIVGRGFRGFGGEPQQSGPAVITTAAHKGK